MSRDIVRTMGDGEEPGDRAVHHRRRLGPTDAARRCGVSRRWVEMLLARHREGSLDALEPRSHAPPHHSNATPDDLVARILQLRHLGIGRAHSGRPVRRLIDHDDVLVADLETGTVLAEFTIDPTRGYQAKKKGPGENRGPAS